MGIVLERFIGKARAFATCVVARPEEKAAAEFQKYLTAFVQFRRAFFPFENAARIHKGCWHVLTNESPLESVDIRHDLHIINTEDHFIVVGTTDTHNKTGKNTVQRDIVFLNRHTGFTPTIKSDHQNNDGHDIEFLDVPLALGHTGKADALNHVSLLLEKAENGEIERNPMSNSIREEQAREAEIWDDEI